MLKLDLKETRWLLRKSDSLEKADRVLAALTPIPRRAARWGIWDGWKDLPETTAGLIGMYDYGDDQVDRIETDYAEGYAAGRNLRLEARWGNDG